MIVQFTRGLRRRREMQFKKPYSFRGDAVKKSVLGTRTIVRDAVRNGRVVRDAVGNGREQSMLETRAIVRDAVRNGLSDAFGVLVL